MVATRVGVVGLRPPRQLGSERKAWFEARPFRARRSSEQRLVAYRIAAAALGVVIALSCEGVVRSLFHTPQPTMFHGDADSYPAP